MARFVPESFAQGEPADVYPRLGFAPHFCPVFYTDTGIDCTIYNFLHLSTFYDLEFPRNFR